MKFAFRFALISLFVLFFLGGISWWAALDGLLNFSFFGYLIMSLVFSISGFVLVLRSYKVDPIKGIMFRITTIVGAVFCMFIWVVVLYPFSWFMNAP